MITDLEKSIYRTIAYFAYFGYPLTSFEVWKWMLRPGQRYRLDDVVRALGSSEWLQNQIESQSGFFGLSGNYGNVGDQVRMRHARFLNAVDKYKKLRRLLNFLTRIPQVRAIALCNTLAFHYTKPESDIDLFIITDKDRVWTARLLAVTPLRLMRQRPGEAGRDAVDVSFFADPTAFGFEALKIDNSDPYLSMWIRALVPVFERQPGVFEDFMLQNPWAARDLPNAKLRQRSFQARFRSKWRLPYLPISERMAESLQSKLMPDDLSGRANEDTCVVVRNNLLKFHKNDRRAEIASALRDRMRIC
ncbi:MAG: hypothetical protein ABIA47_02625 [bacterium]